MFLLLFANSYYFGVIVMGASIRSFTLCDNKPVYFSELAFLLEHRYY